MLSTSLINLTNLPLNLVTIPFHLLICLSSLSDLFPNQYFWSSTTEINHKDLFYLFFFFFVTFSTFNTLSIDTDVIIILAIILLIKIFQLIEFFPWLFVPLPINIRINVSEICFSKRAFSNYFKRRLICTKFHFTRHYYFLMQNYLAY